MVNYKLFGLLVVMLTGAFGSVQYHPDLSRIQAKRVTVYDSLVSISTVANHTFSFTFYQAFNTLPQVFHTVCSFNIANTRIIEYEVRIDSKTPSNASFSLRVGTSSLVYKFSINTIAFNFASLTVNTVSRNSVLCAARAIPSNCLEIFLLPYKSTPVMLYALTALYLDNNYIGQPATTDTTYSFIVSMVQQLGNSYLYTNLAGTSKVYNFTFTYFMAPLTTTNYSLTTKTYVMFTNNQVRTFLSPYTAGELMNNQSAVIGLTGFKLDRANYVSFDATFSNQFQTKVVINRTIVTSTLSYVVIDYMVMGAPFCLLNETLVTYPQADCWACDTLTCASCSGSLCGSCSSTRYLDIISQPNNSGLCRCRPGYLNVNQTCVICDNTCQECAGSTNNCTSCAYGYILVQGSCITTCFMLNSWTGCDICPEGCSICLNATMCQKTICAAPLLYFQDSCLTVCPNGTYADVYSCRTCQENCLICSDYQNCSQCKDGQYIAINGQCRQCDQSCLTCSAAGYNHCIICAIGSDPPVNGICKQVIQKTLIICPSGTFPKDSACEACGIGCDTCSPIQCLHCTATYRLSKEGCILCEAEPGFAIIDEVCTEICGDGIKVFAECDDGNREDGDGCSAQCNIEQNFICEQNTQQKAVGDICYTKGMKIGTSVQRSLISNKILISLFLKVGNLNSMSIKCIQPNSTDSEHSSSIRLTHYQILSQQINIQLTFDSNIEGHRCEISLTTLLKIEVKIQTTPSAYLIEIEPDTIKHLVYCLKALLGLGGIVSILFHGIAPNVTSAFICNICIFYVSFIDVRGTPLLMYILTSSFNEITLTPQSSILKAEYQASSLLNFQNSIPTSWPLWLVFAINLLIPLLLKIIRKKLSKKVFLLFRSPIKQTLRYIHCSFSAYEPIFLVRLLLLHNKKLQILDKVVLGVFFVLEIGSWIILIKILRNKAKFVLANDGPIIRGQTFIYIPFLVWYYKKPLQLAPTLAILLTSCLCISRIFYQIRQNIYKKRCNQLKSQSISSTSSELNTPPKTSFKTIRFRLELFQQFMNDSFFLFNNILILYVSQRADKNFNQQQIVGMIKISILMTFVLIHLVIILWIGIAKIKNIFFPRVATVHVIERDMSQLKQASQQWRNKVIRTKQTRRYSFSTELRITKATTISSTVSNVYV